MLVANTGAIKAAVVCSALYVFLIVMIGSIAGEEESRLRPNFENAPARNYQRDLGTVDISHGRTDDGQRQEMLIEFDGCRIDRQWLYIFWDLS